MFTAQNAEFPGRSSVWLKFTPSEDRPHALMVVLSVIPRHPRESGEKAGIHFNQEDLWIPAFAGMTGFCEACLRLDREEERAFVYATIGFPFLASIQVGEPLDPIDPIVA